MNNSIEEEKQQVIDAEKLPKYCAHHKFLLLEELALLDDFRELHYGKCTIIGRIRITNDNITLENVRLDNCTDIPELPVGTVQLPIVHKNYSGELLQNGAFYILRGEVVLIDINIPDSTKHTILSTARGIHEQLLRLSNNVEREALLENIHRTHKPAVNVWFGNKIEQADAVIKRNLEIRTIIEHRDLSG